MDDKTFLKDITRHLLRIIFAGFFIGYFHKYDEFVTAVLLIKLGIHYYRQKPNTVYTSSLKIIRFGGPLVTGFLGLGTEIWGIGNDYWGYHDLPIDKPFPYWVPVAWALSFGYLYSIRHTLIMYYRIEKFWIKQVICFFTAMIYPTLGEMIAVNFGVWTYNWGYKLFGIPIIVTLLLTVFHYCINLAFTLYCYYIKYDDIVLVSLHSDEKKARDTQETEA